MNKIIKEQIDKLKPSATLAINEESNNLKKSGKKIYKFGFGQSPFPIPDSIVLALKNSSSKNTYLPMQGLEELRKEIANDLNKSNGNSFESDDIVVGPGTKELMFLTQIAFNGEVLLPAPSWVSYQPQALIAKNKVYWIQTDSNANWFPTAKQIEDKIKNIKNKNLLLFLNSPNNPSGTICENLKEIATIAKKYKLIILSDEIYSRLTFDKKYLSISNFYPEGTIISTGLSKWCGAGGWRLGFFAIPNQLKELKTAEEKEKESNQIIEFTKEIKKNSMEFRLKIIEILWKIVYSDEKNDSFESNLIRRVCGLLYVSDKDSGMIKAKITNLKNQN